MKPRRLNAGPDHLSWIEIGEEPNNLEEGFLDAQLFVRSEDDNYFADIIHFLPTAMKSKGYTS